MDRTLISWNIPNWITVLLMAAAGYAVLALAAQAFNRGPPMAAATGGY
jgi:hypothetical protein